MLNAKFINAKAHRFFARIICFHCACACAIDWENNGGMRLCWSWKVGWKEGLTFKYGNLCLNSRGPAIEVIASFSVEGRDKTVAPPPLLLSSMPQALKVIQKFSNIDTRQPAMWQLIHQRNPRRDICSYTSTICHSTLVVCVIQPLGDHSWPF